MDFHSENERPSFTRIPPASVALGHRSSRRKTPGQHGQSVHPNPPLTPNAAPPSTMPQALPNPLLPSAPASPPTPAPSPTPLQRSPTWQEGDDDAEDPILRNARFIFGSLDMASKEAWLTSLVDMCDNQTLGFLHRLVGPRLKKDPFKILPDELCLRVCFWFLSPDDRRCAAVNRTFTRCLNMSMIRKPLSGPRLSPSVGESS